LLEAALNASVSARYREEVIFRLAQYYFASGLDGELDMACEQLEKVLDDDPDSTGALVQLIRLYRERGDLGKIDDLLRMIERRRGRRDSAPGQSPAPDTTPVTG
jgi:lipopolysaccharide biosynthesis regulator YciM